MQPRGLAPVEGGHLPPSSEGGTRVTAKGRDLARAKALACAAISIAAFVACGKPKNGILVHGGLTRANKRVVKDSQIILRESYALSHKIEIPTTLLLAVRTFEEKVLRPVWKRVNKAKNPDILSFTDLMKPRAAKPAFKAGLHLLRQLVQTKKEHAIQRSLVELFKFNPLILRMRARQLTASQRIQSLLVRLTSFIPQSDWWKVVPRRYKDSLLQLGMNRLANVSLALRRASAGIVQLFPHLTVWARPSIRSDLSTSEEEDYSF